ncbi:MAG: PHB depolymerase family esterase [Pseudomonadales bacterium]|jgi:polyhydroxybutyrate depolymerase|tara:strand:+ start:2254 stop:3249 length:996 start_codon:yes stop_codon:yes gene_type:complete
MNQMRKFSAMDKVSGSPKPTRLILFLLLATIASFVNAKGSATDLASGQYDIQSGALTRSYLLHVPKQLTHPAPLVIVMHGYTGSADSIMSYSGMNEVADEEGFVVVYPQGTVDQQGNAFFNVGYEFHADASVDDLQFIRDLVAHLQDELTLNPDKVFAAGMSNGADMSYLLACQASDIFRAVAPIAGVMMKETFDTCSPSRPLPIFEVHGTNDEVSLFNGDMENSGGWGPYPDLPATIAFWVELNGLTLKQSSNLPNSAANDTSHIVFDRYWSETQDNEVWFYRVVDGGHHWPGVQFDWWRNPMAWWYFRNANQDIDTSRVVWSFFESMSD